MAAHNDISSTEKLLDLIRSDAEGPKKGAAPAARKPEAPRRTARRTTALFRKRVKVGADIGRDSLRLVKLVLQGNKWRVMHCEAFPFEPSLLKSDAQFAEFLKSVLTEFCGLLQKTDIWAALPTDRLENKVLKIPKLSRKKMSATVFWTFKKEFSLKEDAHIFDYAVLGENADGRVAKAEVLGLSVQKADVDRLKDLFQRSGFPLHGVTAYPFAFQNILNADRTSSDGDRVCNLHVGRRSSRIDIFSGGRLYLSRSVKTGVDSMISELRHYAGGKDRLTVDPDDVDNDDLVGFIEKKRGVDAEAAERLFYGFLRNDVSREDAGQAGMAPEEVFQAITPALNRLIRQIDRTIRHYCTSYHHNRIDRIFLSGPISARASVAEYIRSELDLTTETLDPFAALLVSSDRRGSPPSEAERNAFVPALGVALSENESTPNFMFTYKEQEKKRRTVWANRLIFGVFLVFMALSVGYYAVQDRRMNEKSNRIEALRSEIERSGLHVTPEFALNLVLQTKNQRRRVQEYVRRHYPLAVISEICQLTPENIRLRRLEVNLGGPSGGNGAASGKRVMMEGLVTGDASAFSASLATYLVRLRNSYLFKGPAVTEEHPGAFEDQNALYFEINMEIVQ